MSEHSDERPFSRLADDLRGRLVGGPDDYLLKPKGPVRYVVVVNMEGVLGALFASDPEGAVGFVVREELGHEASNSSGYWRDLRRSAKQRGLTPGQALTEMTQKGGFPFPGRALTGPWREAPSLAALQEEIVGDGKWDLRPRDLKAHVYPEIALHGPRIGRPEVTEGMRRSARRQPGMLLYAIDPAHAPHGEVPEHAKLGCWRIDENGEIGEEFYVNPGYEPSLTALRWHAPENEVERTLQGVWTRHGTAEGFLDAFREATLLVSVEADGRLLFRQDVDGERVLDVYTGTRFVPDGGQDGGPELRAMNGGELAKGLYGCYVMINRGSRPHLRVPSADLSVSAFG
ncbi:type VII secretion system-associated protein [Streptomyces sp. SID13726]|uniref:type VII secretion system-associated protein n=1 Tax=Streptomyces sp. SID13726 TaxID=2706058 RepID=UPI0013B62975|nr:type VII secretion system-associated protein [Streptomyces sp. SID13726]NEB01434.1 type VII secretion system-associated protein [Streptomyces sp. SID13726]